MMISCVNDTNKVVQAIQLGASDYVTKPVHLEHLFSVLRVWISRNHDSVDFAQANQQSGPRAL